MVKLIHKKLAGSTLIEVLIAMVIILIIFSIAIKVFNNVMASGVAMTKIKAQSQVQLLLSQLQEDGEMLESNLQIDSIDYSFTNDTTSIKTLGLVKITATQNGKFLATTNGFYQKKADAQN